MKIIGISGLARSGKDLFANVAKKIIETEKNLKVEKFALAYELKNDLKDLIYEKTGMDVFTEDTREKNIIRPLLVAYGDVMRKLSNGTYWTNKVEQRIKKSNADVAIITDIRYDIYPEDELYWVQRKMNGLLIHITKYEMSEAPSKRRVTTSKPVKIYNAAPNEHEMLNNPKLQAGANYSFEWEDCTKNLNGMSLQSHPYIVEHVNGALKKINVI